MSAKNQNRFSSQEIELITSMSESDLDKIFKGWFFAEDFTENDTEKTGKNVKSELSKLDK